MKNRIQSFLMVVAISAICLIITSHDVKAEELDNSAVLTQEIIEPFGGIKWDDNLLQIIGKLSAIKGMQNISLHLSNASTDVRNVSTREDLEKTFSDLMLKYNPRIFKDLKPMAENYSGKDGASRKHLLLTPKITASPIVISGVAFELTVKFINTPGLEIVNAVAVPLEKRGGYSFPLVIREVSLASSSATLASSSKNIIKMIETKYRKYDPEENRLTVDQDTSMRGSVSDKNDNTLQIGISPRDAQLTYSSEKYQSQLVDAYQNHLAKAERKANAGKADMGSGL